MLPERDCDFLVRAVPLPPGQSGVMLSVTPQEAGWDSLGFVARRLIAGDTRRPATGGDETALVVLGGRLRIDWGDGPRAIGRRASVFDGLPFTVYLPPGTDYEITAETDVEVAEVRVRASRTFPARLITPADTASEVRGGGDTSRQIVRIIKPEHQADRLMMNEVFTPDGNWSSYPPHKHDVQNLPAECDLDELYYFRVDQPDGFALLRVYDQTGRDQTVAVRDGDLAILRSGYHLVAARPGYRVYYLAMLAGTARSLAAATDPRYEHLRAAWATPDPRLPLVRDDG